MLKTLKLHFSLSTTEMRLSASFSAEVERELLQELKMATAAARLILKALSQYPALRAAVLTKVSSPHNCTILLFLVSSFTLFLLLCSC
jgi:hypothetical protein